MTPAGSAPDLAVSRQSMADQVADALRDMILTGSLMPGERITHDELAKRLGVSTMPVREAMLRLTHEGFIVAKRNRSFRVSVMTRQDLQDIYWMHSLVAGELTARACERANSALIDEMDDLHAQWVALGDHPSAESLEALNDKFHKLINRAAEAPKLLIVLRNTLRFIPEHFYALLPAWRSASTVSHGLILDAFKRRDAEAARQAATDHVNEAGAMLASYFDDAGFWSQPDLVPDSA